MYKGKAIYTPSGKAGEYAKWACNFYVGCSNECEYCYLKKGIGKAVLGGNKPQLKKCFKDENNALEVFKKELLQNLTELQEHGIFFSFTTDPMLDETMDLTLCAIEECFQSYVPVEVLTKNAENIEFCFLGWRGMLGEKQLWFQKHRDKIAIGFTLTGHDELEPNSSPNAERIASMHKLHDAGFKTFASIEPIIDFDSSMEMIEETLGFCDLYKIGLMSGKRDYNKEALRMFVGRACMRIGKAGAKVYWKESLRKYLGREIECTAGVESDYNIFK